MFLLLPAIAYVALTFSTFYIRRLRQPLYGLFTEFSLKLIENDVRLMQPGYAWGKYKRVPSIPIHLNRVGCGSWVLEVDRMSQRHLEYSLSSSENHESHLLEETGATTLSTTFPLWNSLALLCHCSDLQDAWIMGGPSDFTFLEEFGHNCDEKAPLLGRNHDWKKGVSPELFILIGLLTLT